ncbi:MAG TPA: hypothetical protein VK473_10270 [Terriglobales bacterium]|nr:hypothetical protein [Terriglobales bacterium]
MASTARSDVAVIAPGVAPLRAGQGMQFVLRRLHSLSGVFPVGAFLIEHYVSNAYATNGVHAYNKQVEFLTSVPFVWALELFFIYIPILYHSLYGFYIWYRGDGNVGPAYPWAGNWMYTAQRWTGGIAFVYMVYHVWTMRFSGIHIMSNPAAGFTKVYDTFAGSGWIVAFYFIGIIAAAWHFAYGLWLFAAKWGLVTGDNGRRKFGYVCALIGIGLVAIGVATMVAFLSASPRDVPRATEALLH